MSGKNVFLSEDIVIIRILVVDDYAPWRHFISSILRQKRGCRVVCEVSDGLEAVQKARELQPDVILLDISLPKLDGIEAARQIHKLAPNSRVLFLSNEDSLELVEEALNSGASGYIVKADAGSELVKGVRAVFRGNRFLSNRVKGAFAPTATPARFSHAQPAPAVPTKTEITRSHEVQFYSDDAVFLERASQFIGAALRNGNAAIVFVTKSHRDSLVHRLKAQGVDVDAAIQQGTYVSLDAADMLSRFMVKDWPDAVLFFEGFASLIASASKAAKAEYPRGAICGDGVALLWAQGKTAAAIRLEQLSNDLAVTYNVDILCGYRFSLHTQEDTEAFKAICAEHSAVYSR